MPIKFLEDDEVAQPTVSDSVQIQQPTQQKKTIRFLDDNPPIQQAQPLTYTMGTDPEVDKHLDDTKAQWEGIASHLFTEQELLDIRAKGEIGYFESFANNIKIPGASTGWEIAQTIDMANLSRKYSDGTINDGEKKALFDFARSMAEEQIRGYTFMGKVGSAYAQAPAFMIEFAASLGVGKLAASAALKTAEKKVASEVSEGITKEVVKKTVAQKVAQGAVTHGVGATALIAQQAPLGYAERRLNQHLSITDKGEALFTEAQEKPFTSALKAAGSVGVEYVSEISGAAIGKAIVQPVGKIVSPYTNKIGSSLIDRVPSNVKDALFRAYKTVNPNARVEKAFTAAGWNGMIEELGEERVADILRVTLDLDEKEGYSFDQVMTALYPGAEQLLVEAGTIAMIGSSRVALNGAANQLRKLAVKKGISEKDATEMVNNLSQTEIETLFSGMSAQDIKTQIQQVEGAAFELARSQRIDEEEARAWSKVMASNSLWGAVNYNISPKQYFDRLQIGLQNYNAPMTNNEIKSVSMAGFEPDYSGGVVLPYQSNIDYLREYQNKIDSSNARTEAAMVKAEKEGRQYKGARKKSQTPILNFLKSKGGVLIGSELAGELETMGVTSKTHPWLFRKKNSRVTTAQGVVEIPALQSLDAIDPKEISEKTGKSFVATGTSSTDKDGYYADQRDIYKAIDNEIRGIGQQEKSDTQVSEAWYDDMLNVLDRAGVSLANTDEEINAALMELSRSYNYDDGQTYFQGQLKTDTEAFKKWFGDSKVVDKDGKPLVVYHGSEHTGFNQFDPYTVGSNTGNASNGFYFTESRMNAETYSGSKKDAVIYNKEDIVADPTKYDVHAEENDDGSFIAYTPEGVDFRGDTREDALGKAAEHMGRTGGAEAGNYAVYLSIQNPLRVDFEGRSWDGSLDGEYDGFPSMHDWENEAHQGGYDGVIAENVTDEGRHGRGYGWGEKTFIAFSPEQIKSVHNRGTWDSNDARILYQSPVSDEKLMVVHNLSAKNLVNANKVGGLAIPSLAVTRTDIPFDSFGDITLIAPPSLADPQADKANKVFDADVYSPRYPSVIYETNSKKLNPFIELVGKLNGDVKFSDIDRITEDVSEKGIDGLLDNRAVKYAYLAEKGEAPEVVYREKKQTIVDTSPAFKKFVGRDSWSLKDDPEFLAEVKNYADKMIKEDKSFERVYYEDGELNRNIVRSYAATVQHYTDTPEVDTYETGKDLDKLSSDDVDFKAWVESKTDGVVTAEKIFNGFTPSGNRRYLPHNLDNVVKLMKGSIQGAEGFNYGVPSIRAVLAKKFKSLKDIKKDSDRLITSEQMDAVKEEIGKDFDDLWDRFSQKLQGEYKFGDLDNFSNILADVAKTSRFSKLKSFYKDVSQDDIDAVNLFLQKLKNLPTQYFEVKVQRPVNINEFVGAIVADNTPKDALKILDDNNIPYTTYKRSEDGDRAKVTDRFVKSLNEKSRVLFQSAFHGSPHRFDKFTLDHIGSGEGAQAYGWGLYFAGKKSVAEYYKQKLSKDEKEFVITNNGSERVVKERDITTWEAEALSDIARYGYDEALSLNKKARDRDNLEEKFPTLFLKYSRIVSEIEGIGNGSDVKSRDAGQLYEVSIPENDVLLDWDKPLSKQHKSVRDALAVWGYEVNDKDIAAYDDALLSALTGDGDTNLPNKPDDPTGEEIYRRMNMYVGRNRSNLEKKFGSDVWGRADKISSELLNDSGIKGIKYLDGTSRKYGEGTHNYVIFDDNAIKILDKLYQDNRASVQFMRDGRKIISLLAGADKSSLLHETGHIFLRELMNAAQVSDIAKEQLKAVSAYVGAKEGQEFTVEQEEVFARGFERYLMEGTAPNNYLRDAFESFRDWFIEIYNNVMGLNAPMNNDAREFFDALLGGKDLDIYMKPVQIENHESGWAKFYRYMVDDLSPIHQAVKAAQAVRGAFPDGTNPEWLARLFAASKGRLVENIQNQTYYIDDKGNPVITGEGFKPILEDFDAEFAKIEPDYEARFEDLKQYLIARRYIEDLDKRDDVEVSAKQLEESADTIARIGEKYGDNAIRFQDYAERIYGFQKRILENLVRSGIMSQESFDAITKDNQHYIPFQRVFDENEIDESFFSLGGRGRFVTQSNPVKSIEGSTREVKDPFSQIIINSARILMAAERNRVSAGIAAMAAYLPDNIQPVKQPMKKITLDDGTVTYRPDGIPDGTVIEYRTDGKRRFVKVSKPMYEALQGMHPHQANMFERIFTGISSFFRGAATLPPDFWIRNFIRDVNSASVQSKHGLKPVDVIKGILAVAKKNDLYHEWMKAGGSFNSYMELDDKGAQKAFEELLRPQGRTMLYVKSGGIELLKDASGAVEQATRIAMFARARAKGETAIGAALQSRDGTLDFSRAGKWGRVANRYIPFLNAGIQGSDKLIRAFRDQPAVMTWRAFMTISIPSIVLTGYYLYGAPDDEREEYLEIPQWQKDMFWCFKANGEWWRIPKPFALGYAFGSLPERFLLWSYQGEKPEAENIWREFVLGLGGSLSPIQDVGTLMTPVGRIVVESLSNYNFFTDRPIYPKWMESLPMEERATKHQSETAMLLGELSGQSPAIIENAIRGMLATTTPYVLGAGDGLINSVKKWNGEDLIEKPVTPSDTVFVRGFSVRSPDGYRSVSASNFFDKWEEIKQHNTSFNRKIGDERTEYREKYDNQIRAYKPMKGFYDRMDSLQERVDSIYENENMTGDEKLSEIRDIEKQITEIAREANKWYIFNVRNEE